LSSISLPFFPFRVKEAFEGEGEKERKERKKEKKKRQKKRQKREILGVRSQTRI